MTLPVVEQNLYFLRQGAQFLERLDDETYAAPESDRPRAAGVGPHFRHCLDFYLCFLRDLEEGRIDYDRRDRRPDLETDRRAALAELENIIDRLVGIGARQTREGIQVHHDSVPDEPSATAWHRSTVDRELRFLASHTVHHFALIARIARERGVEPGESFGVAPATLEYWSRQTSAGA